MAAATAILVVDYQDGALGPCPDLAPAAGFSQALTGVPGADLVLGLERHQFLQADGHA